MSKKWAASVAGDAPDIEDWQHVLKVGFDPWIEVHGNETLLRSASFATLETAEEVRDRALALIDMLNGLIALSQGSKPVRFNGVVHIDNGKLHRTTFASLHVNLSNVRMRATVSVLRPDGTPTPPPPPRPSDAQTWAKVAETDQLLEDALTYFGKANDWFDIYKTVESLEQRYGGERPLTAMDWAPASETKRLKQTVNWARHARGKFARPSKPMSLEEARNLLAALLRRALHEAQS